MLHVMMIVTESQIYELSPHEKGRRGWGDRGYPGAVWSWPSLSSCRLTGSHYRTCRCARWSTLISKSFRKSFFAWLFSQKLICKVLSWYNSKPFYNCLCISSVILFVTLSLKMLREFASKNVICLCRLLNIHANFSNLFLHTGKPCGPWSECSWRSSLIWVPTVCNNDF